MRPAPPAPPKRNGTQATLEQPPATTQGQQQDGQTVTTPAVGVGVGGDSSSSLGSDKPSSETVGAAEPPSGNEDRPLNLSKEDRFGTLTSISQYLDLDLDITEDEPGGGGGNSDSKTHSRSGSLVMLHENSVSLPEFPPLQADRDLSSPEGRQQISPGSEGQGDNSSGGGGTGPDGGSLAGGVGKEKGHKKRSSKRGGSVKVRSRSPPNLPPPPPPPPLSDPLDRRPSPLPAEKPQSLLLSSFPLSINNLPPPPPFYPPSPTKCVPSSDSLPSVPASSLLGRKGSSDPPRCGNDPSNQKDGGDQATSMEFTDVMNTISNIEQQLNELECQSPIRRKESATFRPISASPNDNLTSPEFSDGSKDSGSLQRQEDLQYDHLHGNDDDNKLLYDHLSSGNGLGEGGGNGSSAPSQCVQFSAHSTDPLSFLKSKTPPVREVFDARLRLSVEVSCSDEEELFNKNVSPKKAVSKQITKRIFFPEESSLTAPPPLKDLIPKVENRDLPQKPSNRRNQKVVTFKVEGTDTTETSGPSQLQQVTTAPFVLQAVPTTTTASGVVETTGSPEVTAAKIANIKKMLFGEKESAVTQRYRKDSGTTEPCAERLLGGGESQKGDSNNNSNCSNLYEVPWEQKPVAKYAPEFRKYENVHVGVAERQAGRGVLCRPVMVQGSRINTAGIIGVGGDGDQASQLPEAKMAVNPSEKMCNGGGLTPPLSTSSTGMMWTEALVKVQSSLPPSSQGGQSVSVQNGSLHSVPHASVEVPGKTAVSLPADGVRVQAQSSSPKTQHTTSVQKHPRDNNSFGRRVEFTLPESKGQSVSHATPFEQPVQQGSYVYRSLV